VAEGDERSRGAEGSSALTLVPPGQNGAISFVRFEPNPPFDERLMFLQDRRSDSAAAFRLLRQRLIERGDPRVILCTSANRHEGKTTLATNLAMAYAELGKRRVLLVEASFRSAALGEAFGFLPPRGFGHQIAQRRSRPKDPWTVVQIGGAPLFVMAAEPRACKSCARILGEAAGFCPMCGTKVEPPSGIDGVAFSTAINEFRESFDYLIVDAPPVLGGGEVNLIQDSADAIVFATRRGQTEARNLKRAIEQVAPAPVAAVALID
jgi:Mrp family chromosome partitioning ATPase